MTSTFAKKLISALGERSPVAFTITLPDGSTLPCGSGPSAFNLRLHDDTALRSTMTRGHMGLLEAYFDGTADVEGDFGAAMATGLMANLAPKIDVVNRLENAHHEWRHSNRTVARAKANARAHYGLGTEFYRRWLDDPLMMYTCAYWAEGVTTLEQAQQAKIDHVCRKIRLAPGDRFVDIGCGFGGFMFRAQEKIGAAGVGINTTTEQVEWLAGEIGRRGLADRLSVREADFREIGEQFDKVVSIGVLEHAGRDQLAEVVAAHAAALKPGGLGMLHFIGHVGSFETELFIRKHVFPGGWIPSLAETIVEMERCGLEVVDIENLRRHYALTLDVWTERFERRWDEIQALDPQRFDERFRRIWRVYLVGCAEMFRSPAGYTHLFQITFSKGNVTRENYPMSRAHLYA